MRHCQRADTHKGVFDNWLVKTDPPLTPEGEKQAKILAKYYTDYWKANNMTFDKVIIETSPFMRCIQSASALADGLNVPEIEINFMAGEHLYARDFAEYSPVPVLNSVTTPLDDE